MIETLDTPTFLVAMPQIVEPFFQRAVVLLLEHDDEEGSFGLIANRPTELALSEILEGLGAEWRGRETATGWFGGPVQPNVGTILFEGPSPIEGAPGSVVEFHPDVRLSRDVRVLTAIAASPPDRFRLLLGYAGWGRGQLQSEIERNDWLIAPFDTGKLFDGDASEMWARALESIGVRPEALPSWTTSGEGETSN